ncbi:MAG: Unknown protein [uncultured Sulfurovum sp.]|uniref:Uncharacterized protein n=1 Tax=uncultured Sulfurovum sp. TaxID=269237 RepID=A0A6S6S581_9BACT|nr:MAG: Unknown protein [uncultured Sulfurovum sp.]
MFNKISLLVLFNTFAFTGGFDDGISESITIGDKTKIKHMARTYKNGIVGDTLYVYEADKRDIVEDKEGALKINTVETNSKTLKKNRKLTVVQITENSNIKRISGKTKNRDVLKSQEKEKEGVTLGLINIENTRIKNVKAYRRNNHIIIED